MKISAASTAAIPTALSQIGVQIKTDAALAANPESTLLRRLRIFSRSRITQSCSSSRNVLIEARQIQITPQPIWRTSYLSLSAFN